MPRLVPVLPLLCPVAALVGRVRGEGLVAFVAAALLPGFEKSDRGVKLAMWAIVTAPVALLRVPPKVSTCL